nr:immunoglobulin light chain junction region [Macaca mulatta]MOW32040.1 immunoglobulin light chain junction region [Macaca mulatta]
DYYCQSYDVILDTHVFF